MACEDFPCCGHDAGTCGTGIISFDYEDEFAEEWVDEFAQDYN